MVILTQLRGYPLFTGLSESELDQIAACVSRRAFGKGVYLTCSGVDSAAVLDGDGNTAEPVPFDLDGAPRFRDTGSGAAPIVDMGAYETLDLVDAGPDQLALEGNLVTFTATTSITAIEGISWDFGDGTVAAGVLTLAHTFLDSGVFTVMLTVTDTLHSVAKDRLLVTVANADPVLGLLSDQIAQLGTPLEIRVSFSDPGALDTHTVQINWGDGYITDGEVDPLNSLVSGSHTYAAPGDYPLTLTIYDDDGGADALTIQVLVVDTVYQYNLPVIMHH